MKVPYTFTTLQKTNALLLVAGAQTAVLYRLRDGEIHERETVRISKPEYTDREGRFEHREGSGTLHGSGSVYESKDYYIEQKFFKELHKRISSVKQSYDSVYVFAPLRMLERLVKTLPVPVAGKIKRKFSGNFIKHHPLDLLKKIRSIRRFTAKTEARMRVYGEAKEILNRPDR